jgi:hypothetical protein
MDERTLIVNGRLFHNLNGWTAAGGAAYSAGNGDSHYGVASLPAGASISQQIAVEYARAYTLHVATYGGNATIGLVDSALNSLPAQTASGVSSAWTENSITVGLAPGTSYTLTISNGGVSTILVDDIWLWWVPKTRAELAAIVARKLATLASDASLSTTPAGSQTEGSYTDAVDAGLRGVGAIDEETDLPDIRYLSASLLDSCLAQIERAILEKLQRHYALLVDTEAEAVKEKFSQIAATLKSFTAGGASGSKSGQVVVRQLRRSAADYELLP